MNLLEELTNDKAFEGIWNMIRKHTRAHTNAREFEIHAC